MCYYVALVVRGSDPASIDRVLRSHGRQAKPINNPSIRRALIPGEAQFLTTVGHCDCGTALAPTVIDRAGKRAEQAAKLVKKGWSQAKIDRWLSDREKADDRAEERRHANTPDSVGLWSRIIADVLATPGVQQAGLLVHFYSGDVENEVIEPIRESVAVRDFEARLANIREDQLLVAVA
jgi:hypothetical protein